MSLISQNVFIINQPTKETLQYIERQILKKDHFRCAKHGTFGQSHYLRNKKRKRKSMQRMEKIYPVWQLNAYFSHLEPVFPIILNTPKTIQTWLCAFQVKFYKRFLININCNWLPDSSSKKIKETCYFSLNLVNSWFYSDINYIFIIKYQRE